MSFFVTVTSFINIRYGNVAIEIIPQWTAFCYSFAVSKIGQSSLTTTKLAVYFQHVNDEWMIDYILIAF